MHRGMRRSRSLLDPAPLVPPIAESGFNKLDEPRIVKARRALREVVPQIAALRNLGLVVHGPGRVNGYTGLTVAGVPRAAATEIIASAKALQPAETLDHRNRPASLVLVTDGQETCGGAPCKLAAELAANAPA